MSVAISAALPILIVFVLGGTFELYDYVVLTIFIVLIVGTVGSTILDAIKDKIIIKYTTIKRIGRIKATIIKDKINKIYWNNRHYINSFKEVLRRRDPHHLTPYSRIGPYGPRSAGR